MRVSKILDHTKAEGPGSRFCIWVQGCNHKCNGCFATDMWDYNGGYEINVKDIIMKIDNVKENIDGITLLGGEPFDKANELSEIAEYTHFINKNVITFTGYTYEQIISSKNQEWNKLIENTDLLIDGKFDSNLVDYSRPLVGSLNQRFFYLTNRISRDKIENYKNRLELRYDKNGKISINGMGNVQKLVEYINKLKGVKNE